MFVRNSREFIEYLVASMFDNRLQSRISGVALTNDTNGSLEVCYYLGLDSTRLALAWRQVPAIFSVNITDLIKAIFPGEDCETVRVINGYRIYRDPSVLAMLGAS